MHQHHQESRGFYLFTDRAAVSLIFQKQGNSTTLWSLNEMQEICSISGTINRLELDLISFNYILEYFFFEHTTISFQKELFCCTGSLYKIWPFVFFSLLKTVYLIPKLEVVYDPLPDSC